MNKQQLTIIIILSIISVFILNQSYNVLPTGEKWGELDYQSHLKFMQDPTKYANEYPTIIYFLYPLFPYSLFAHLAIILPSCLYLFAQQYNKTGFKAYAIYSLSGQAVFLIAIGVMKEIILIELILLSMAALLFLMNKKMIKTAVSLSLIGAGLFLLLEPPERIISSVFLKGYNNFYFTSLWGLALCPIAIIELWKNKTVKNLTLLLIITALYVGGVLLETRLLSLGFLLAIPPSMPVLKKIGNKINKRWVLND